MLEHLNLPLSSIILAPSYYHPMIRNELTKTKTGCIGIHIHTITSYFISESNQSFPDLMEVMFAYKNRIEEIFSSCSIYRSILFTPAFLEECHAFLEMMRFYNIPMNQLPKETPADQERHFILSHLQDLPSTQLLLNASLSTLTHCENIVILDTFYTYEEQVIIDKLLAKGATLLPMAHNVQVKECYYAMNMRQEIEGIAQMIIERDYHAEQCVITLANPAYKPVMEQVFQRYHIPYTILSQSHTSSITQRFLNTLTYALSHDRKDLMKCFDCGLFLNEHTDDLRTYLEIFHSSIDQPFHHLSILKAQGHILDTLELDKLKSLQEKAELARKAVVQALISLKQQDATSLIEAILAIVKDTVTTADDIQVYRAMQDMVAQSYAFLHTEDDLLFLAAYLKKIDETQSIREMEGVIISDLSQLVPEADVHFLLGATQNNYPAFRTQKGLFDETYWAKTPLPTMEMRYQHHLTQCDKLLHANRVCIVSYPLGNYEGKANEIALEIEEFMPQDPSGRCVIPSLPLLESYEPIQRYYQIHAETAKKLFVKDHKIKASISAIERYIHCPYAYFLRYGLSLREPMKLGFDTSYMGTMAHYILETLVLEYGKQYAQATYERLDEIVSHEVAAIQNVFPNNEDLMTVMKQRFLSSFTQTLHRLAAFEMHSAMKPWLCEHEFHMDMAIDDQVSFALKGYIDRIDTSGNFNCILDYKSSMKSLSEDKVFAALQLQLLTYSIVVKHDFHKDILGAYYISLKNENIPFEAGSMKRRPVGYIEHTLADYEDAVIKAHRIHGWTMRKDIDMLDDNGAHIVGVSMNKDGVVKARKYYRYETIYTYFQQIYQQLGKRMLAGDIDCTPDSDACMFCTYASICRFKGVTSERKVMVTLDDNLYWEGGNEDADME